MTWSNATMTPKTRVVDDDTILRGLHAISRDGLDGAISPRALYAMIGQGHIKIGKVAGRFTSTKRRVRALFDAAMDGGQS
jgi:hypothetical protein